MQQKDGEGVALVIVGLSGKRSSGKDFFGGLFRKYVTHQEGPQEKQLHDFPALNCETKSLANSFKQVFADHAGLSFDRLMNDRDYKEQHRKEMNAFFANIHQADPYRWGRALVESVQADTQIVVVTDVRLKTDIPSLRRAAASHEERLRAQGKTSGRVALCFVRIHCKEEIRRRFGWTFDAAIDGHFTETDLDEYTEWDYQIENEGNVECFQFHARQLYTFLKQRGMIPPSPLEEQS